MEIRRALAADRPDAFRPNLATSFGAMGSILRASDEHAGARDAFAEGLATLTPILMAYPQGAAPLAVNLLRDYLQSCEAATTDPNSELLEPIIEILHQIGAISLGANA